MSTGDPTKVFLYDGDEALQARVPVKAGSHEVVATILKAEDPEPEGVGPDHIPLWSRQSDTPNTADRHFVDVHRRPV